MPVICNIDQCVNGVYTPAGCSVLGGKNGIHMVYGDDGRVSGDCFVELRSDEDLKAALIKHRNNMGRRYVEGKRYRSWW